MPDIAAELASGLINPWTYLPFAVLLGALHALEPGHSKGLMTAYIVAIRGTVGQAMALGLSAAISHSAVVWGLVLLAFALGRETIEAQAQPWLVLVSGLFVLAIAFRLYREISGKGHSHSHRHDDHGHDDHDHTDETHDHHDHASCGHVHAPPPKDAHVSFGSIIWFGLTAGLMPCPSALAVLVVALKTGAVGLGLAMVGAFSLGLAISLVGVGLIAALGVRKASTFSGFARFAKVLPFASLALVSLIGLTLVGEGLWQLLHRA